MTNAPQTASPLIEVPETPAEEARRRWAPVWLIIVAQAVWPGTGFALAGQVAAGFVTMCAWPIAIITTHMRLVEGEGSDAARTAGWFAVLAVAWVSAVWRGVTLARAGDVATQRPIAGRRTSLPVWLVSRNWLLLVAAIFLVDRMALDAEVDFREFFKSENISALRRLSTGLLHPDFSIMKMVIADYAWITLEMAVIGTVIGSAVSAPISFFGARNILGRNPATAWIYYVTRFILSVVRSIPTLIWGLMALSFGLGHFPGVIALSIFSFGLTAKLFSEAIEAIDHGPVEAVTAAGANPLHTLLFGVVPQVVPYFISSFLYCLEVNVHSSVVLGLIGAGGLGLIINEYIATFHWEEASTVLIVTIVMTLSIDYGSAYIRGKVV